MIIIFEGQERTGKTTVSKMLETKLKSEGILTERIKLGRSSDTIATMIEEIFPKLQNEDTIFLLDRFHITEAVCRTLDDTITEEKLEKIEAIDLFFKSFNTLLVLLECSDGNVIRQRHINTDRDIVYESFCHPRKEYKRFYEKSNMFKTCFETSRYTPEQIVDNLFSLIILM